MAYQQDIMCGSRNEATASPISFLGDSPGLLGLYKSGLDRSETLLDLLHMGPLIRVLLPAPGDQFVQLCIHLVRLGGAESSRHPLSIRI